MSETENRRAVVRGCKLGEGGQPGGGELLFNGYKASVLQDEKGPETDGGND